MEIYAILAGFEKKVVASNSVDTGSAVGGAVLLSYAVIGLCQWLGNITYSKAKYCFAFVFKKPWLL